MFRSTNKAAMLLMLVTGGLSVDPAHEYGPGGDGAGMTGEPHSGYHIRTCDPSKAWDADITRTDGSTVKNQRIVADADANETNPLLVDPADGIYGAGANPKLLYWDKVGNYSFSSNLFNTPTQTSLKMNPKSATPGETNYPSSQQSNGYQWKFLSTMQQIGYCDSDDGVILKTAGADVGYNKFSKDKEHMLLYFGADWSPDCNKFTEHFAQYYKTLDHNKVEAVYIGHEETEEAFNAYRSKMPFPATRFETYDPTNSLTDRLSSVLGVRQIPALVVVDKKGNVLTTEGVKAIKGEDFSGTYPLPKAAELFTDDAILPGDGHASIETGEQRTKLIEVARAAIMTMPEAELRERAKGTDKEPAMANYQTATVDEMRDFLIKLSDKVIKAASAAEIEQKYAKLERIENNPVNYHFKAGEYVRVVKDMMADPEVPGAPTSMIPSTAGGRTNVGKILQVTPAGAIKVQFIDNMYANRWLLPEHFDCIEEITQKAAEDIYGFPKNA